MLAERWEDYETTHRKWQGHDRNMKVKFNWSGNSKVTQGERAQKVLCGQSWVQPSYCFTELEKWRWNRTKQRNSPSKAVNKITYNEFCFGKNVWFHWLSVLIQLSSWDNVKDMGMWRKNSFQVYLRQNRVWLNHRQCKNTSECEYACRQHSKEKCFALHVSAEEAYGTFPIWLTKYVYLSLTFSTT